MKRLTLSLLFVVLLFLLALPLSAQDSTADPAPTVEGPTVINVEEGASVVIEDDGTADEPQSNDGSLWGYVLVIGGIIVGGVVTISFVLQGIGNKAEAAARNSLVLANLEKAYDSIPSAVVKTIVDPIKESLERSDEALQRVIDLFERVTDNQAGNVLTVEAVEGDPIYKEVTSGFGRPTETSPRPLNDSTSHG